MRKLHAQGRDHIWAYYTRNLVRPVALSRAKVDVIIGNPPWINYNQTIDVLRSELENQSKDRYGIWVGGNNASNQDVAGLFFARSVDLYLNQGGVIGFVMPHSTLRAGHYAKWRSGKWQSPPRGRGRGRASSFNLSVEFNYKMAWDLEQLEPNTFFPVASCVVFARSTGQSGIAAPLAREVELWRGAAGARNNRRVKQRIADTSTNEISAYDGYTRRGGDVFPRCLFFVIETPNPAIIQAGQTITVNPRRGNQDKKPWNRLDLTTIGSQTIEKNHLFDIHLGETVVPYNTLEPLRALLPVKQGEYAIPVDDNGPGGIRLGGLERRMRERWQTISSLWEDNKAEANRLNLLGNLNYLGKLSSQLEWQQNSAGRPIRVVYPKAGQPTATIVLDDDTIIDTTCYWISCKTVQEANYLLAIINSDTLANAVNPYTTPNWAGNTRDLHKHLWKLPIPEYNPATTLHAGIAQAGATAAQGAATRLAQLRAEYQKRREAWEASGRRGRQPELTVTIARRELRAWLRASPEGAAVEAAVSCLLTGST